MAVNHEERNKRMTTMELDAFKARLIKDICMADTLEYVATSLAIPGVPGTPEELEQVIDDFERQLDEGTFRGLTLEEANAQIRQKFSWLK